MPFVIRDTPLPAGENTLTQPTIPHFAFPFQMSTQDGKLTANVVEQDSLEEIVSCVQAVCNCPIGAWSDQPSFGIPNELFSGAPLNTLAIENAITNWEPRATAAATEYPDLMSDAIRHVQINVSAQQSDQ